MFNRLEYFGRPLRQVLN